MQETTAGFLEAQIDPARCNACGTCTKVCPGSHIDSQLTTGMQDPFTGSLLAAYCGYAVDPPARRQGQSGGIVTALLAFLLESGQIDRAAVTRMPEDGTLRPITELISDPQELRSAQGSKYCPVAVNSALKDTSGIGERIAVVGLPCHVHGLRHLELHSTRWRDEHPLTIGLVCDRSLSYLAIDYLARQCRLQSSEIGHIIYRDTVRDGWPGNVTFVMRDGIIHSLPAAKRIGCKDPFTPARCRLCCDKLNVLSDIAVGDAWGIREDREGFSAILARTARGLKVLDSAVDAGVIKLEPVDPQQVFKGQKVEERRKLWACYTQAWQEMGRHAPTFSIALNKDHIDSRSLKACRRQLEWANSLGQHKYRKQVLRAAETCIRNNKVLAYLHPMRALRIVLRMLTGR